MKIAVAGGTGLAGGYAVEALRKRGHEPVVLSRAAGVDVRTGDGLAGALHGVDAIIDALSTTDRNDAEAFHVETTRALQQAGAEAGARQLVTLSIVGIDRVTAFPYYQAKLAQERAAQQGPLPASIVRATQFHEFAAQVLGWTRKGPVAMVPSMTVQTIAARSVGDVLAEIAAGEPLAAPLDVAGPEVTKLPSRARAIRKARHRRLLIVPVPVPGQAGKQMRAGGQLPLAGARIEGPRFQDWLLTADAARPAF